MKKKLQLKVLVILCFLVVIIIYFYVNKGSSFDFGNDFNNFKDSLAPEIEDLSQSEIWDKLVDGFNNVQEEVENEAGDSNLNMVEERITGEFLNKLSENNIIAYEYEPWGIGFDYDASMLKEFDQEQNQIILFYEDNETKVILEKDVIENLSFNDWLNKNYDLQILDKLSYNNLIFWKNDLSDEINRHEEYFVNSQETIFTITLVIPKSEHNDFPLEKIIESFYIQEGINL